MTRGTIVRACCCGENGLEPVSVELGLHQTLVGVVETGREAPRLLEIIGITVVIEIADDHRHDHRVAERRLGAGKAILDLASGGTAVAAHGVAVIAGFATEYQAIAALRRAAAARRGAGGLGHAIGGTPVTEVIILGRGIAAFGAFNLAVATHRGLAARGCAHPTGLH